ncbi:type IV pilus biogenesis/stability protein PilW [Pseudoalteromonas sp. GCY]|uniref:type IV pilus biogenesis/stability protein PilW n=1 Tax=Pseudoalteromonas sp. GCY TaxID=2003316 RepID=UPI000BFF0B20|nr:type IV pilus biogenesis/stability protein PilW [Pseudoalteromonas sp. GCY]PHI36499.1 type IV pilus biogenesis/stability protein PilW [Pseudoalteromonas sp. GCY]QQQ67812.1 type IV pilus biogenesis/stability protein PilW [Pseudoalteromonas sp. GCY]
MQSRNYRKTGLAASILAGASLVLSGCVTESSYRSDGRPVAEQQVNNTNAARTRIALALQYLNSGNTTSAKFNLERALQLAPKLAEAHYTLAYYYEQVGEQQRADNAYQAALDIEPDNPDTLNNYGTFLCRVGQYNKASQYFFKAIEVPSYLRVSASYENLALCALKQNEYSLAEEYLQSAIKHNAQQMSSQLALAGLYYARSDFLRAEDVLDNVAKRGFISPRSLMLGHLVHMQMGHLQKAQDIATTLVQSYPKSAQAGLLLTNNIAASEFERLRNRYREAQLNKLAEASPSHIVANPKIKIKRKKTQSNSTQSFTVDSPAEANNFAPSAKPEVVKSTSLVNVSSDSEARVEFYQPDPSEVTFSPRSREPQVLANTSSSGTSVPLLNSDVAPPQVPFHTVIAGENLFSISVKYDIKMVELMEYNQVRESARLYAGQKVYLNNPNVVHEIAAGDTLLSIADRYGVLIDEIMRWNKLTPDVALQAGHGLLIVDPTNYVL